MSAAQSHDIDPGILSSINFAGVEATFRHNQEVAIGFDQQLRKELENYGVVFIDLYQRDQLKASVYNPETGQETYGLFYARMANEAILMRLVSLCTHLETRQQPMSQEEFGYAKDYWQKLVYGKHLGQPWIDIVERHIPGTFSQDTNSIDSSNEIGIEKESFIDAPDNQFSLNSIVEKIGSVPGFLENEALSVAIVLACIKTLSTKAESLGLTFQATNFKKQLGHWLGRQNMNPAIWRPTFAWLFPESKT